MRNYEDEYNQAQEQTALDPSIPAKVYSGFNPNAAAEASSSNLPPGPTPWQAGYDTLLKQLGAVQGQQDVYKGRSPLSADTHIQNIATSLARDYGVNSINDIEVRPRQVPVMVGDLSNEGGGQPIDSGMTETVYDYFSKNSGKQIPESKFASEGRGDGYSNYNLKPVPDGKGGFIALPVQQYSKSGMGAFVEDLAPVMPVINLALMAAGVPPLTMAAGNVALQAAGGNVNNIGDALKIAAPFLLQAGLQELPELTEGLRSGPEVAGYNKLTEAGQIASNLTGLSGIAANTVGGAAAGGIGSLLAGRDAGQGLLTGGLGGVAASAGDKIYQAALDSGFDKTAANAISRAATSVIRGLPSGDFEQIVANAGLSGAGAYLSKAVADATGSKFAGNAAALALQSAAGFDPNPSAYLTLLTQGKNELAAKEGATNNTANTTQTSNATSTNPADATINTILAGTADPLDQLQASDLGTGQRLDTVNVAGTSGTDTGNNLVLSNLGGRSDATNNPTLTSAQLAALTSTQLSSVVVTGNLPGLDSNTIANLTSGDLGTKGVSSTPINALTSQQVSALTSAQLPSVLVTAQKPGLDTSTLTDTVTAKNVVNTSSGPVTALSSATTALNSSQIAALSTSPIALASNQLATVVVTGQRPGLDTSTLTDVITSTPPARTSAPVALTTTQVAAVTSGFPAALTSGLTTLLTSDVGPFTSKQIGAMTSGTSALTSNQISALTTTEARGLQALGTSQERYWRQTGAQGTGGKGGVRFFDWYDTPENRTMAPPAMTSVNIPAITSQQAQAMTTPAPKQYFNQATNRYYTDSTGQWTPPAGWTRTGLKDGGEVKTKHYDGGGYADFDLGLDESLGNDWAQDLSYAPLGDLTGGADAAAAKTAADEADAQNVKNITAANAATDGSSILDRLLKLAKDNPNLTKLLASAGIGGLLGYAGRPKPVNPLGMQGGSLGLTQAQVHGALKGIPVKRAGGGEIDGYAGGGGLHYLKSAEDGMADKIPATIDNKQPAKLSGGEFVIPADVVSHLGNGNSEAGAKQLYDMMDRIRHARTGTKKQGKQINPAKFTPK
jgi:hypothetical protein